MTAVIRRIGPPLRWVGSALRRLRVPVPRWAQAVRPPYQVVIVLGLMVAVLAVSVYALHAHLSYLRGVEAAREAAVQAAQQHAQEILSYDYRTIAEDIERAKADITGSFREDYSAHAAEVLMPTAKEQQAVVTATVRGASVVQAEPERVQVLLFVNQSRVREGEEETKIDQNRVRMTLAKVGDQWLVAKLEAL